MAEVLLPSFTTLAVSSAIVTFASSRSWHLAGPQRATSTRDTLRDHRPFIGNAFHDVDGIPRVARARRGEHTVNIVLTL